MGKSAKLHKRVVSINLWFTISFLILSIAAQKAEVLFDRIVLHPKYGYNICAITSSDGEEEGDA
jgi:hypothetical protein